MAEHATSVERTGRCLCGACVFTAKIAATESGELIVDACHCGMCRRWTGGPLMAVETVGEPSFHEGAPIGVFPSSEWAERGFCQQCGTALFYRLRAGGLVSLPAGLIDSLSPALFGREIFVEQQPDYYAFEGERPRMTEAEVIAAFSGAGNS